MVLARQSNAFGQDIFPAEYPLFLGVGVIWTDQIKLEFITDSANRLFSISSQAIAVSEG